MKECRDCACKVTRSGGREDTGCTVDGGDLLVLETIGQHYADRLRQMQQCAQKCGVIVMVHPRSSRRRVDNLPQHTRPRPKFTRPAIGRHRGPELPLAGINRSWMSGAHENIQ
jgi:hypothetical protein